MQREYKLENWSVIETPNSPYVPPECKVKRLHGSCPERAREVYYKLTEDLQKDDITTSAISKIDGRKITTESGNIYLLGEVDPKYIEYLDSIGIKLDQENPIKWIKEKEHV